MRVGIHPDSNFRITKFVSKYIKILEFNRINYVILSVRDSDFWEQLKKVDIFIYRWRHTDNERQIAKDILPIVESFYNKKVFPNQDTCWHFDDKVKQYYLMKAKGFPFIDSQIFYSKKEAVNWVNLKANYPIVYKHRHGAGSKNVLLLKTKINARRMIRKSFSSRGVSDINWWNFGSTDGKNFLKSIALDIRFRLNTLRGKEHKEIWQRSKNHILFQKFLPANQFDTRVTVIGGRAFAFRRINREGDFRSSGSGNIDFNPDLIDLEHVKNALNISREMSFQSMAYDFLYNESGGSEFCEISYTFNDTAVHSCPGYWDDQLKWHDGHYWPQYLQLKDLLSREELKQPDFDDD